MNQYPGPQKEHGERRTIRHETKSWWEETKRQPRSDNKQALNSANSTNQYLGPQKGHGERSKMRHETKSWWEERDRQSMKPMRRHSTVGQRIAYRLRQFRFFFLFTRAM